jgi:hypothetical protein
MISTFKDDKGNIVMLFTNESKTMLKNTLANLIEELRNVVDTAKGKEFISNVDGERCETALSDIKQIFGELLDAKEGYNEAKRYADDFNTPMVYNNKTEGYKVLSEIPERIWSDFLDELAKKGLTCNYNTTHDTFTIG